MFISRISTTAGPTIAPPLTLSVPSGRGTLTAEVRVPSQPPTLPPMLALHGISRDAASIGREFARPCAEQGRVLITPHFSSRNWSHFQTIGKKRPDLALLDLLALVEKMGLAGTGRVSIFGYSGGAQLAHRFAMLYPHRVQALHLAAAGWYCLPDRSAPFPMALGASDTPLKLDVPRLAQGQLPAFLRLPVRLYVGNRDVQRDDALRKHPTLDAAQGRHRLARASSFVAAFQAAAQARCICADIDLIELPDCAHDFVSCARRGLTAFASKT